jgi:oligopeptide/dipeptide ABC transporter ATP-binding protein
VTATATAGTTPAERGDVLLDVRDVVKHFPVKGGVSGRGKTKVHAVEGVSLEVRSGETLGLVGESGCGKSTLARLMTALQPATSGQVIFKGHDITKLRRRQMRPLRRQVQMVFQDPYGSLNPRRRVGSILGEPFAVHDIASGDERKRKVQELMEVVGLSPEHYNRFPAEFSGGQRQRIGIARALALRPELIVCDEPVSALDVSIQAQILNLIEDLQVEFGLTYVFIAHDLSVVRHVSNRVAVMYLGRIAEIGPVEEIYSRAKHPYTASLLSAVPVVEVSKGGKRRERIILEGGVPSSITPPSGCRFHPRCPKAQAICSEVDPELKLMGAAHDEHFVACHFPVVKEDSLALASWEGPDPSGAPASLRPESGRPESAPPGSAPPGSGSGL